MATAIDHTINITTAATNIVAANTIIITTSGSAGNVGRRRWRRVFANRVLCCKNWVHNMHACNTLRHSLLAYICACVVRMRVST